MKRKKPDFIRQGWHKFLRLGKHVKKRRKWRAAKGGDSKTRLRERGKPARPTIGWGSDKGIRGKINGVIPVRIENVSQLEKMKSGESIIIASVGKKKRMEISKMATDKKIKILNRYRENKNATK